MWDIFISHANDESINSIIYSVYDVYVCLKYTTTLHTVQNNTINVTM